MAVELARTLDDSGQLLSSPMAHGVAAIVLAGRGELDAARAHVAAAERAMAARATSPPGCGSSRPGPHRGGGRRRRGRRRDPAAAGRRPAGVGLPEGTQPWRGRPRRRARGHRPARRRRARAGRLQARTTARTARACAATSRAAGAVAAAQGDDDRRRGEYAAGLAVDDAPPRARWPGPGSSSPPALRTAARPAAGGRRRSSIAPSAGSSDLGAEPFVARARQERAACAVGARPDGGRRTLTRAESTVAALVAEGRTNREVAASLVVSVKTVESHLARIFDKLAVRSRTELAIEWRRQERVTLTVRDPDVTPRAAKFRVPPDDSTGAGAMRPSRCGW